MDAILSDAMQIHNISAYLQHFDATETPALEMEEAIGDDARAAPEEPRLSLAEVDVIRRELEADFSRRLRAEKDAHESRLSLAREEWTHAEAGRLGRRFLEALEAAFAELRADVARVVAPFLSEAFQKKALDELTQAVRQAISDTRDPVLRLAGPEDLIEKVASALGADVAVNLTASGDVDVIADLSPSKIETRLAEWRDSLVAAGRGDA
ncbi:hypothetical protein ACNHKD_06715 [Methylocystis sp. JAN1]|uniref:hypothetical protein n=1 Tax=Methylocystis sp. JAN1 TaxID=3397211 RepID=UPI003FA2BDBF